MDQYNLSDFFTTRGQATDFSARLSMLSEKIYKTDFNLEQSLMEIFGIQKKDKFLTLLRENHVTTESPSSLEDFIKKIQQAISQLPAFSLTIAFEPKEATLKTISDWFVLNLKTQALFDFVVDPSLIAGATITYNGTFKDYSFKQPVIQKIQLYLQSLSHVSTHPPVSPNQQNIHQSVEHFTLGR